MNGLWALDEYCTTIIRNKETTYKYCVGNSLLAPPLLGEDAPPVPRGGEKDEPHQPRRREGERKGLDTVPGEDEIRLARRPKKKHTTKKKKEKNRPAKKSEGKNKNCDQKRGPAFSVVARGGLARLSTRTPLSESDGFVIGECAQQAGFMGEGGVGNLWKKMAANAKQDETRSRTGMVSKSK